MSIDMLINSICKKQNPTVVGLDPKLEFVPEYIKEKSYQKYGETLKAASKAVLEYNKGIIDAICDIVPAVKPQAAYYEMLGPSGMKALYKTQEYAKKRGMYIITDGKRNDIGTTMEAYAAAHLGVIKIGSKTYTPFIADSLTVNGYLGTDGITPLLKTAKEYNKSIFVLVKTSNPSSGELQDKKIDNASVYEVLGKMCETWGNELPGMYGYTGVGAVIGATYPEQIAEMRKKLPRTFFLIPGYGAQGGNVENIKSAFDKSGIGGIVNSSRAIICAYKTEKCSESDYAAAARREAIRMRDELRDAIGEMKI